MDQLDEIDVSPDAAYIAAVRELGASYGYPNYFSEVLKNPNDTKFIIQELEHKNFWSNIGYCSFGFVFILLAIFVPDQVLTALFLIIAFCALRVSIPSAIRVNKRLKDLSRLAQEYGKVP